jgi:nitronate monooxygenase
VLGTRFTEMFGLDHPVMSAPMAGHSGGGLAGAVSGAGGLGSFGGMGPGLGPGWITEQVADLRSITERPFAIGFITPFLDFAAPLLDEALGQHPDAICLSFAAPGAWADRVRDAGAKLICQVQDLDGADVAVESGADVLIAQGTEAGGHTGSMSLLPLLASVVDRHPQIPVLAAGGIGDGRTMAAAMVAGADGVMMGTAFLATVEATEVDDTYKELIVASDGADTVLTDVYDIVGGYPFPSSISDRMRVNRFNTEWAGREEELRARREEFRAHVSASGPFDPEVHAARYGQGAGFVHGIRPAAAVLRAVVESAEAVLRDRPATLLS